MQSSYKLSCEISAKDSTCMIGNIKSQYGFCLVESFSVTQSWERSLMQKSYMITYKKLNFITVHSKVFEIWALEIS